MTKSQCAKCGIVAHLVNCKDERENGWKIHKMPQFADHTCFEILHSVHGKEIFMCRLAEAGINSRYKYTTKKNHPLVMELREKHGLSPEFTRKRRRVASSVSMEEEDESDNNSGENNETTEIHEL